MLFGECGRGEAKMEDVAAEAGKLFSAESAVGEMLPGLCRFVVMEQGVELVRGEMRAHAGPLFPEDFVVARTWSRAR